MSVAPVGPNVHQTPYVEVHLPSEAALDDEIAVDEGGDSAQFILGQILGPCIAVDPGRFDYLLRAGQADTVYVGQRHNRLLVPRYVNPNDSRHEPSLSLPLLMAWVCAYDPDDPFTPYNTAVFTHSPD